MFIQKIQKSPPGVELMPLWLSGDVFLGKFAKLTGTVFEIEYRITFFAKKKCAFWKSSSEQAECNTDRQGRRLLSQVSNYCGQRPRTIIGKRSRKHQKILPVEGTLINLMDSCSRKTMRSVKSCHLLKKS